MSPTRRRRALPVLNFDDIAIASPCDESWDAMVGDARVRHCAGCDKNVYNLSAMGRLEAAELIAEKEGACCVRFHRRPDGKVLTSDCPVGLARVRRRVRRAALSVAALVAGVVAAVLGGHPAARKACAWGQGLSTAAAALVVPPEPVVMGEAVMPEVAMGKMALPPPPAPPGAP